MHNLHFLRVRSDTPEEAITLSSSSTREWVGDKGHVMVVSVFGKDENRTDDIVYNESNHYKITSIVDLEQRILNLSIEPTLPYPHYMPKDLYEINTNLTYWQSKFDYHDLNLSLWEGELRSGQLDKEGVTNLSENPNYIVAMDIQIKRRTDDWFI